MSIRTLTNFYNCTIESILSGFITAWYGNCSAQGSKELQRVVNTAQTITYPSHSSSSEQILCTHEACPSGMASLNMFRMEAREVQHHEDILVRSILYDDGSSFVWFDDNVVICLAVKLKPSGDAFNARFISCADKVTQNVTQPQHTIRALKTNHNIVIKPAHKVGAIVIQNRTDYSKEVSRQLNNQEHYGQLPANPTKENTHELNRLIKTLDPVLHSFLCTLILCTSHDLRPMLYTEYVDNIFFLCTHDRVPFVVQYFPGAGKLCYALRSLRHVIDDKEHLANFIPTPLFLAFKQPPNVKTNHCSQQTTRPSGQHRPQRRTTLSWQLLQDMADLQHGHYHHMLEHHPHVHGRYTCDSANVYLIRCRQGCPKAWYIGETMQMLRQRMNGQHATIARQECSLPAGEHFSGQEYSASDLQVNAIQGGCQDTQCRIAVQKLIAQFCAMQKASTMIL
eukprot:g39133.t1